MANAFLKPTAIVNTVLQMLQKDLVLPGLVWLNGLGDFAGKYNDTITIRIPQPTVAHTRVLRGTGAARNLTASDLTETSIDVKLTDDVYNLVLLTDEEENLDIISFADQVLRRQVRAVSELLETSISTTIQDAPYQELHQGAVDQLWNAVISARRALNDAKVPKEGRVLIVGSAIEEALLLDDRFVRQDSAGDIGAARLQEAQVGRLAGYNVFVVDTIPHGAAYLFHPTAFVMISRPPGHPFSNNVAVASVASENGLALRWIGDYDSTAATDRSLVECWVGTKAVIDPDPGFVRAARVQLTATSATVGNTGGVTAAAGAGHTRQLTLVDNNGDDRAADPSVTWSSADVTKATVVAGLVTGVAAGTSVLTAVIDGTLTKTYTVTTS